MATLSNPAFASAKAARSSFEFDREAMPLAFSLDSLQYHLQFGDMNSATELFLGTNCIWRVCQGLLRIADLIAPVESN